MRKLSKENNIKQNRIIGLSILVSQVRANNINFTIVEKLKLNVEQMAIIKNNLDMNIWKLYDLVYKEVR